MTRRSMSAAQAARQNRRNPDGTYAPMHATGTPTRIDLRPTGWTSPDNPYRDLEGRDLHQACMDGADRPEMWPWVLACADSAPNLASYERRELVERLAWRVSAKPDKATRELVERLVTHENGVARCRMASLFPDMATRFVDDESGLVRAAAARHRPDLFVHDKDEQVLGSVAWWIDDADVVLDILDRAATRQLKDTALSRIVEIEQETGKRLPVPDATRLSRIDTRDEMHTACDADDDNALGALVGTHVVAIENNEIVFADGTRLGFHGGSDCCTFYEAEVDPLKEGPIDAIVTAVVVDEEAYGDAPEFARLVLLSDRDPFGEVVIEGDTGNGCYVQGFTIWVEDPQG